MKLLALILALVLTACASRQPNDCVPQAVMMAEGLTAKGIQSRVLLITADTLKHAVAVYLYPTGKNTLWVWDADWKSIRLRAYFDQPKSVAKAWLKATNHPQLLTSAEYL